MSTNSEKCKRCGEVAESYEFDNESTFWGKIGAERVTRTTRYLRFLATYYRRNPKFGSPMLTVDERQPLCSECWGLMVGRFMQGRSIAAFPGKETW